MPAASTLLTRRAFASVVAAATLLTLSACVDLPQQPTLPTSTPTPSASSPAEPEPTATAAPQPIDVTCEQLIDADTMYSFDPNYALLDSFEPSPGSVGADQVAAGGVACRWVRESGGGTIDLSVAAYTDEQIVELKNEAFAESQMVPTYGEEAYFEVENDKGTAIVFQGRYRLVISSVAFFEPGEPTQLIESALAAL
jgi:hypothetical protein